MTLVVVPVRYPLTDHSRRTLEAAITEARERDAALTVLHVNLYQDDRRVTRTALKRTVERSFGRLDFARYVVRRSFLVEEAILEEVAAEDADVVVIGYKQMPRWRRTLRRLFGTPDIESILRGEVDCELISVPGR